jgi:hypothetical protein
MRKVSSISRLSIPRELFSSLSTESVVRASRLRATTIDGRPRCIPR